MGFYTKYGEYFHCNNWFKLTFEFFKGDGGVDISPIADLLKSEVRAVAAALGVSNEIIIAPPTDGLYGDTRTDEDQIGATYDELEWAMNYLDLDKSKQAETTLTDRQKTVLEIYNQRHAANLHKMVEIPRCIISNELKTN